MNISEITQSQWWPLIKDGSVILAALIGGSWAFFRVLAERTFRAALIIGITYLTKPVAGVHLVHLDVTLTNRSKTRLRAKVCREAGWAFDDGTERLRHSCGLQIKQI